ncbi:9943_t:CDS:2, partial [Dentiscutata erythropus]
LEENVALEKKECWVPNKRNLCRNYLKKCQYFKNQYTQEEQKVILSLEVAKDHKSIQQNFVNDNNDKSSLPLIHLFTSYPSTSSLSISYTPVSDLSISHSFTSGLSTSHLSTKTTKQSFLENLVTNWIELSNQENSFDNNHSDLNFSFGGRNIHPADNEEAK